MTVNSQQFPLVTLDNATSFEFPYLRLSSVTCDTDHLNFQGKLQTHFDGCYKRFNIVFESSPSFYSLAGSINVDLIIKIWRNIQNEIDHQAVLTFSLNSRVSPRPIVSFSLTPPRPSRLTEIVALKAQKEENCVASPGEKFCRMRSEVCCADEQEQGLWFIFLLGIPAVARDTVVEQSKMIFQLIPFTVKEFTILFSSVEATERLEVITTFAAFFSRVFPGNSLTSREDRKSASLFAFKSSRTSSSNEFLKGYKFLVSEILSQIGPQERFLFCEHAELIIRTFFDSEEYGKARGRDDLSLLKQLLLTPLPNFETRSKVLLLTIQLFCGGYISSSYWGPAGESFYEGVLLKAIELIAKIPSEESMDHFFTEVHLLARITKLNRKNMQSEALQLLDVWHLIPEGETKKITDLASKLRYPDDGATSATSYCQIVALLATSDRSSWNRAFLLTSTVMHAFAAKKELLGMPLAALCPLVLNLALSAGNGRNCETVEDFAAYLESNADSWSNLDGVPLESLWGTLLILCVISQIEPDRPTHPLLSLLLETILRGTHNAKIAYLYQGYRMRKFTPFKLSEVILSTQAALKRFALMDKTEKELFLDRCHSLMPPTSFATSAHQQALFLESLAMIDGERKRENVILSTQILLNFSVQNDDKVRLLKKIFGGEEIFETLVEEEFAHVRFDSTHYLEQELIGLASELVILLNTLPVTEFLECLDLADSLMTMYQIDGLPNTPHIAKLAVVTKWIAEIPASLRRGLKKFVFPMFKTYVEVQKFSFWRWIKILKALPEKLDLKGLHENLWRVKEFVGVSDVANEVVGALMQLKIDELAQSEFDEVSKEAL